MFSPELFVREEEDEHCLIEFGKDEGGRGRGEGRWGAEMDTSPPGLLGAGSPAGHKRQNLRLEPYFLHTMSCDSGALLSVSAHCPPTIWKGITLASEAPCRDQ